MKNIHVTDVGRQVAFSGLQPETAHYLLAYIARNHSSLCPMVPDEQQGSGDPQQLNYCLINACLSSPEFVGNQPPRFIHYGFDTVIQNELVEAYAENLAEAPWQANRSAANAASLLMDWIDGVPVHLLEDRLPEVRAGTIKGLCRDVVWCLSGLSHILAAATKTSLSTEEQPQALRAIPAQAVKDMRRLIAPMRLLSWRIDTGLPTHVLWMTELKTASGERAVSQQEAISLHQVGLSSFESLRRRSNWHRLIEILSATGSTDPQKRATQIQQLANEWHETIRSRFKVQQTRRLQAADQHLIENLYSSRDKHFENALEAILTRVGIPYTLFDSGQKPGAFDYILHIEGKLDVILECKTKQDNNLVDLNAARVVLSSSEQFGYRDNFCVTLCQPGVDPNVPENLQACVRLCVVETHDIAEAFTRIIRQSLSIQSFHDWLTQPGQVKAETLLSYTRSSAEPETPTT